MKDCEKCGEKVFMSGHPGYEPSKFKCKNCGHIEIALPDRDS